MKNKSKIWAARKRFEKKNGKLREDTIDFPWCNSCRSYHHPINPSCRINKTYTDTVEGFTMEHLMRIAVAAYAVIEETESWNVGASKPYFDSLRKELQP